MPWRQWPWWLLGAIVLMEVVGHGVVRSRVPPQDDWQAAAEFLHAEQAATDAYVAAPEWADPLLRWHVGDLIPPRAAARSDLAPFERLWEVSVRGHRGQHVPLDPAFERSFGSVHVRRFDLGPSSVEYDLVDQIRAARVTIGERNCRWGPARISNGGLWQGPLWPRQRHFCGPQQWLWVGETIIEDLDFQPRRCIWQHPAQGEVVSSAFSDVPIGERLVLYAGLYYPHERELTRPPVTARVLVNDVEIGRLVHADGDSWKRVELDPDPLHTGVAHGRVTIEVSADNPDMRSICWAATMRGPAREVGE